MKKVTTVCLLAPRPPKKQSGKHSSGGIVTWTQLILNSEYKNENIAFYSIDTLPVLRSVYKLPTWKRIVGGGGDLVRITIKFLYALALKRIEVVQTIDQRY